MGRKGLRQIFHSVAGKGLSLGAGRGAFLGCRKRVLMAYHHIVFSHKFHQLNHWVLLCLFWLLMYQVKTSWSKCLCNDIIDIQIHYVCYLYLHYGPSLKQLQRNHVFWSLQFFVMSQVLLSVMKDLCLKSGCCSSYEQKCENDIFAYCVCVPLNVL